MSLREYNQKRDFNRTKEPSGGSAPRQAKKSLLFVIQKHDATRLHYDFRLEMEGVLKSWAVPRGLPTAKGDRRLAVEVEDHPFDYANFEGTIPKGNYGGGTVMVWDTGTYKALADDKLKALVDGKLHFLLHGKKLKGEWALVRMKPRPDEDKPQWLIFKSGEDHVPFTAKEENLSAITKRTMDQIAEGDDEWVSNRPVKKVKASSERDLSPRKTRSARKTEARLLPAEKPQVNLRRLPAKRPGFVEPMKAQLVETLPRGEEWIYEIKFDGVRALAIKRGKELELISRSHKDLSHKYGVVLHQLEKMPAREFVLDGEVVAVDAEGRSSFQLLQNYQSAKGSKPPLFYYVFDLINLDGKDLSGLPLFQRKAMAESMVTDVSPMIRFSPSIKADSERLMKKMQARGLEGLISKRRDSRYEAGRRSGNWVKFKWTNEQEFVIGGYSEPKGSRSYFGSILVGYYEGKNLKFAAKVGTGFDEKLLASLHAQFQKLRRPDCPFSNLPEKPPGLTASQLKKCTWLEPKLVGQVRFAEWTRDGHLRQPAFLGLREDKEAKEVVRETKR